MPHKTFTLRTFLVAFIVVVTISGCTKSPHVDKRLVVAYTDVLVSRYSVGDSAQSGSVFDSVAKVHGYTPEEMRTALRSMADDYKVMKAFYDSVSVRLDSMRKSVMDSEKR